ncbi:MAG TPA: ATP-binding cassette domain-containing protein, partial [Firmicutes bacterium]|nr:ATP-binding cassette domain-containing protein [Bacillota bacterium]
MTSHAQDIDTSEGFHTFTGCDTPIVEVCDLVHQRGDHTLVDGVSFSVARGEYIALMGPNGSGKTTLARHLNAMLHPTSGVVCVLGKTTTDPSNTDAIRREVGLVFQDPDDQMVAVTVEDEIAFGLENRAVPRNEMLRRVDETIARFELEHVRDRATTSLSGGEQQRVAIAAGERCG